MINPQTLEGESDWTDKKSFFVSSGINGFFSKRSEKGKLLE
jgi:hypothetical protein